MKLYTAFSAFVFCVTAIFCEAAAAQNDYKYKDSRRYGGQRIVVRQKVPTVRELAGKMPDKDAARKGAEKFFAALDALPESFVKRTGLKYVTFLEAPTFKKLSIGGLAAGDTIFLALPVSEKTVYHELFHIFDTLKPIKKWQNINDRKFVYTGSQYYAANLTKAKRKRKDRNLSTGKYDQDFVSRYAMSNEVEDRAETFAHMIVENKNFLKRTEKIPVLRKKMKFLIDMTDKNKLLGREFWQKNFEVSDLSLL